MMASGKIVVKTVDPAKGVTLIDAPGYGNWKTETGCYCCQHSYNALNNPFSMSSRRQAWRRQADGNMDCMMAWSMMGNFMDRENPSASSALGVLALIPEFILSAA